jgi:hypothetical protein
MSESVQQQPEAEADFASDCTDGLESSCSVVNAMGYWRLHERVDR